MPLVQIEEHGSSLEKERERERETERERVLIITLRISRVSEEARTPHWGLTTCGCASAGAVI